ncbi:MAG: hypothetical protein FJ410_08465 [Verrucomicrobia bacterium]|nr:hypothetical protein [Verrucomicrobiota bacterium]
MRNVLVKALGSLAPLIHSDTGTMDRWLWVKKRLTVTRNGERLLLTSPWHHYDPTSPDAAGPFLKVEDGWHVRRGYARRMFEELSFDGGFMVEEIDYNVGRLAIWLFQRLKFCLPLGLDCDIQA